MSNIPKPDFKRIYHEEVWKLVPNAMGYSKTSGGQK